MDVIAILEAIEQLPATDVEKIYQKAVLRRDPTYWLVPGTILLHIQRAMQPVYDDATMRGMTSEEMDKAIAEAVFEGRRERKAYRGN
jgi:hypothetical protein